MGFKVSPATEQHYERGVTPRWQSVAMSETSGAYFVNAANLLIAVAGRFGLIAPGFRTPPRIVGVQRTVRRRPGGGMSEPEQILSHVIPIVRGQIVAGVEIEPDGTSQFVIAHPPRRHGQFEPQPPVVHPPSHEGVVVGERQFQSLLGEHSGGQVHVALAIPGRQSEQSLGAAGSEFPCCLQREGCVGPITPHLQ